MTAVAKLPQPKYLARLSKDGEWLELLPADDWTAEMWAHGTEPVYSAEQMRAALSPAELGGVDYINPLDVFRIAGGDVECCPSPTAEQALECLRDLRQCYDESLSTPRAAEAEWLPIESAPKDGTAILAFWAPRPDHPYFQTVDGGNYAVAEFREYEWRPSGDDEDTTCWANPTHWRPLPAPPSLTPPSAKGE